MLATVCTRQEDDTNFFKSRSNEWCVEEKENSRVGDDYFPAQKEVMNFLKFFSFYQSIWSFVVSIGGNIWNMS